jgi:hypothetical protein
MSLKAVELQVALPRTQEAGRIQEIQQQKQMHEHQYAVDTRNQLDRSMQQRAADITETDKGIIKEKQEKRNRRGLKEEKAAAQTEQKQKDDSVSMRDPLRGRHIDISL